PFSCAPRDRHSFPTRRSSDLFSGTQALQLKMVDALGSLEDAVNAAAKLANLPTPPSVERPRRRFSIIELLRNELGLPAPGRPNSDRKSTRLNSSHQIISYAVF